MTLEGIAFGERFATAEREIVGQQAFWQHGRRIYAVEIAMRPDGTLPETSGRRTDDKFHFGRAGHRRSLLIQGVRVQRGIAVPEAAVRRAPRTRWFGATEKNRRHARRGHFLYWTAGDGLERTLACAPDQTFR